LVARSVVDTLNELITIPSVNPRLAAACDETPGEGSLTEWLGQHFTRSGLAWAVQSVHPGRSNIIAMLPGRRGDTLLWEAHQDTVSGAGMTVEPFSPNVRDGRVYGRGACDVKGSLAALLVALDWLSQQPPARLPNILFACTINEESGFTGARSLAKLWQADPTESEDPGIEPSGGLTLETLRRLRPARAVIAEPTELNVVIAHRGVVRWQCSAFGRAAHSSRPEDGLNAIYPMARVVRLVEDYHCCELASRPVDPLCGPPTVCVTTISGGTGPNTIPDRAVIDIDRRLTPDEQPEAAYAELVRHLDDKAELNGCRLEHARPWMQSLGLKADHSRAWAEQVSSAARVAGVDSQLVGVPFGTNAASIAAAGIPTVVFGPGSIAQAHTADEWIAIDQLERAVDVLQHIALSPIVG
jgi:acetylornithine deacetylase/succinyl-diaminopimelate desuccinylase-like protein